MPMVAAVLMLLAVGGSVKPEQWLGVFPQLPGARRLCEQHQQTISVTLANGHKTLVVHPVSAPHPECGVKPGSGDRTIVVVSEKVP